MQNSIKFWRVSTSEKELKDLLKAWIAVSIAFAIAMRGSSLFSADFYFKFVISAMTVGAGFLLHELGHKIAAQRYGCFAEFRSFDNMLILAIAMSFFRVIFAAPGAVMISGRVNVRKNGVISAAGPAVNLVLALAFASFYFAPLPGLLKSMASYGFVINTWLALFNMIPFWLFDGYKIFKWSKLAYFSIVGIALAFMVSQKFILLKA